MYWIFRYIFRPILGKLKVIYNQAEFNQARILQHLKFYNEEIMETLDTITGKANAALAALTAIDSKLEEVKTFIGTLSLPQDKLDQLGALLDNVNTLANAELEKADKLDEPPAA